MEIVKRSFGRPGFGGDSFRIRLGASPRLGQSAYEWYQRAKAALSTFEKLLARTDRIANKTAREEIIAWLGSATNSDEPLGRYYAVLDDVVHDVEGFTPLNYGAYALERRQNRVEKLEDFDEEFQTKVVGAEKQYGILPAPPAPTTITTTVIKETPGPSLTVPILIAGGGIALALLLS